MLMFTIEGSSCNNNRRLTVLVYEKTKSLWGWCVTTIDIWKAKNRCTIYWERPAFFPSLCATDSFRRLSHWNIQVEPSPFLLRKLSWQKRQVADLSIFSFFWQSFTGCDSMAMELLPCLSVFAFHICKRFVNCNFWLACTKINVDVETDGLHWTLGFSLNSFSHCSWLKKELLSLSAKFSAQFGLNDFFSFFCLVVADESRHDLFFFSEGHQSCGMYCMIKWCHSTLWFVWWQVTPQWQDLSTGN